MTELFACFAMWAGLCGHVELINFATDAQCAQALVEIRKSEKLTYAFCRPPQPKGGR